MNRLEELRRAARKIYESALAASDARRAVLDAVELRGDLLRICGEEFELRGRLYCVALGKSACAMGSALEERVGTRLTRGVVSGPPSGGARLSSRWHTFVGGHPLPNEESLAAARAAFELLGEARDESVVVFLVSGGGSAMMEWPRHPSVTLEDLRDANRALVSCGAGIAEVNAVRRALSAVKGGRLAARSPLTTQLTLIVSDTPEGREADVASGPTLGPAGEPPYLEVLKRYGLGGVLPPRVARALEDSGGTPDVRPEVGVRRRFVLLDNARAREAAAREARARGLIVEVAADISDQQIEGGVAALAARLSSLIRREGGRDVCLVSGGEFACPVRGPGAGGRNSETALRLAFEFEGMKAGALVALCAGTDGLDGNSPAAGALSDHTTLTRARARGLAPEQALASSDSHTLFRALDDDLLTGPTGTNVRDLRILLAG